MRRSEKGFTLMEMMVTIAISSFITYALITGINVSGDQIKTSNLTMSLQDSAREGLYKMLQEIRQSGPAEIAFDAGGTGITFGVPDVANSATGNLDWDQLTSIRYRRGCNNGVAFDNCNIAGCAGNNCLIRRDMGANTVKVMAQDVTGVTFAGNAAQPTLVTVTLSVQKVLEGRRTIPATPLQVTGRAKIRNA